MVKTPGICLGDAGSTPALGVSLFCAFNTSSCPPRWTPSLGRYYTLQNAQFRDPGNQPPPPSQLHQRLALSPTLRQQQPQLPQHPTLNPQGPTLNPWHQPPVLNNRRNSANHHHHQRCTPRTQPLSSHPTSQSQQRIGSQVLV